MTTRAPSSAAKPMRCSMSSPDVAMAVTDEARSPRASRPAWTSAARSAAGSHVRQHRWRGPEVDVVDAGRLYAVQRPV